MGEGEDPGAMNLDFGRSWAWKIERVGLADSYTLDLERSMNETNAKYAGPTTAVLRGFAEQLNQPTMLGRANELLNHVSDLERHVCAVQSDLFGMVPSDGSQPEPPTLDGMLAGACERVASLCREMATIRDRVGTRNQVPKSLDDPRR